MSNTTLELVSSTDPADFLGKAKEALPDRLLPTVESLENDSRYAEVFMDQIREEAVSELLKSLKAENLTSLKDFDTNIDSILSLVKEVQNYQSKAHIKYPTYRDIKLSEEERVLFTFNDKVPVGETVLTTLDFLANIIGTLSEQANRVYEDGQYYPTQLNDVSAYVRPSNLIRPIEFDRYPSLDIDTIINNNVVGKYDVLWNDKGSHPLTCNEKNIDQETAEENVTVEDWREIDLFLASTETSYLLEQLSDQFVQYRKRALDYLKATQTELSDIHNQGDLANLARIVLGLNQNHCLINSAMTEAARFYESYLQTLQVCIMKIDEVTKG